MQEAYAKDNQVSQFPPDRCGWRSRVQIAQALGLPTKSFYGKNSREINSDIQDLLTNHRLEMKYFEGERGRGGEIMRFRMLQQDSSRTKPGERVISKKVDFVPTGVEDLDRILGGGYAGSSAIMLNGPEGIGKESLGYFFLQKGIEQGDYCLHVTHQPVVNVIKSMQEFGSRTDRVPNFIASSGSPKVCDLNDPSTIATEIIRLIEQKKEHQRVRIVTDILSPLLALNSSDFPYTYWNVLISKIKAQDGILIALTNEEMHPPGTLSSIRELFDTEIEFKIYERGLSLTPLLRIKKIFGMSSLNVYFTFGFSESRGMEITPYVRS
jgi:KaiC/GvpD/RAD55 family RecA-like ATPase